MQRILRDTQVMLGGTFESYQAKVALIHRHFPPSIGTMFALPRNGQGDTLEWWTELPGQPLRFDALTKEEQALLLERFEQRQKSLGHLADELVRRGETDAGESLRTLIGPADKQHLYSLNGEPVVIRWGAEMVNTAAPIVTPKPAPVVATPVAAPVSVKRQSFRPLLWLLPLLFLLVAAGLLYFLWPLEHYWNSGPDEEAVPYACREDEQGLPPEFVLIFDTSGSMNLNIEATQADEDWYFNMPQFRQMMLRDLGNERLLALEAGPSRLEIAKESVSRVINQLHSDIDAGLITYAGCGNPVEQGIFSLEQRTQLINGIQSLHAYDGTPLAQSLVAAAGLVDGRERDATIIAFVDGVDGCGQNQCQIAAEIAQNQPRLTINVVDVTQGGLSNCLAEHSGGQVFSSQNAAEISGMLEKASAQLLDASHCE
ncbi:vWA domain-containing protein [Halomonas alkaliantarctica]|uniref:vWA domain-containing protein n=1 Tax=Halomonas alkaliantarctica TaxID=232346 RepID=UPI002659C4EB|nr:VWA domain-containing protein [Halomonas alkaliantarctica]